MVRRYPDVPALAAIVLCAVLTRLVVQVGAPVFIMKDSASYFVPGWDLAHGFGFDLELRRTPFYPVFVAAVLRLFGDSLTPLALAQHLLGVGSSLVIYWAGRLAFGRLVGLLAGLLTAISGPQVIYEHFVMPEGLFTFLNVLGVTLLLLAMRSGRRRWYFVGGLVLGVAALTRPAAQLAIAALPLALLAARHSLRSTAISTATALAGLSFVVAPWMLSVYREYGVVSTGATFGEPLIFRMTNQDTGFVFPDRGLNPYDDRVRNQARRLVIEMASRRENPSEMVEELRRRWKLSRPAADAALRDVAFETIRNQPGYYLASTARLTAELFLGRHEALEFSWTRRRDRAGDLMQDNWAEVERIRHLVQPATAAQRAMYDEVDLAVNIFQPSLFSPLIALLFLTGTAACLLRPEWRPGLLLPLTASALILTCTLFSGAVPRFRYPADPFIHAVALAGALVLAQSFRAVWRRLRPGLTSPTRTSAAPQTRPRPS